jgi:phenylpropionate dioxygenase-like ring-hydroxylating dioxygenase large terminal subunit
MTTKAEGELLTRVGPGTALGGLMREYWIPAALSSELTADGPPVRLVLLGEKLIAFRDSAGRVGIMDHRCPHRCASLFYGRNEDSGIRCIYHGWKFDVDGNCLDQPNLPEHQVFKHKVKAKAYRAYEKNGLVWVYMGARAVPPPLPGFEALGLPESQLRITFAQRDCNWLQAFEGDIDTSHFSFLHLGGLKPDEVAEDQVGRHVVANRRPDFEFLPTEYGAVYGAFRDAGAGQNYWRVGHYLFPFWTMPPTGPFRENAVVRGWVPMDDTHTMFLSVSWTGTTQSIRSRKDGTPIPGHIGQVFHRPNGTGWHERWRLIDDASNDYGQSREMQKSGGSYTGIVGIHLQDQCITESMGDITDFSFEHMAPSDVMVTQCRRRLLAAARAHRKTGALPPGVDAPELFRGARGGEFLSPANYDLARAYKDQVRVATNPTGILSAAE